MSDLDMTLDELIVDAIDKSRVATEAQDRLTSALDAIDPEHKKEVGWKLFWWAKQAVEG